MKYRKKNRNIKLKKLAILLICVVLGAIGLVAYTHYRKRAEVPAANGQTIIYSPATDEEKKNNDINKEQIVANNNIQDTPTQTPGSNTQKKSVTPIITNTSSSINAYIPGIFEDGGVCTASFTKSGITKTKTSVGFQNVSYTQCSPIMLENNFLSPGQWAVTISYNSTSASGTSAPQTIEVN